MKRQKGSILIRLGLLLIAAALFLAAYNLWEERRAGRAARETVAQLLETVEVQPPENRPESAPEETTTEVEIPDYILDPGREMPVETVDGEDYIGVLRIPALDLELPIHSQWSYKRLKTAPCRYSGSAYQDDLVLCAHNYATHFGGLKSLRTGDEVTFTDVDGNRFRYQVAAVEALAPTDIEEMTAGDWPLTLFTCTPGGQSRVAVRCTGGEYEIDG